MELFREKPYFAGVGDIRAFVETYRDNMEKSGGQGLMCIPSGNHDMPRLAHTLDDGQQRLAFAFLLSMPGAPFIYYGDEIGMHYLEGLKSVEGGYHRTGARSPMQWDSSESAGFSEADVERFYIPLDPDPRRPNAADAMADKTSLWWEIHALIRLRQAHPALGTLGGIEFVHAGEGDEPLVYCRYRDGESILVAVNPGEETRFVSVPYVEGTLLHSVGAAGGSLCGGELALPAGSVNFFEL